MLPDDRPLLPQPMNHEKQNVHLNRYVHTIFRDLENDCSGKTTDCNGNVFTYADLISVAAPGSSSGGGSSGGGNSGNGNGPPPNSGK